MFVFHVIKGSFFFVFMIEAYIIFKCFLQLKAYIMFAFLTVIEIVLAVFRNYLRLNKVHIYVLFFLVTIYHKTESNIVFE